MKIIMGMENVVNSPEFTLNEELAKEATLLERFTGNAKRIARVMTLVSTLSAAPGLVQESYAQQATPGARTEQVSKGIAINESNVTESGSWSKMILEDLHSKYTLESFERTLGNLDQIIKKATVQSSYANRKQREALKDSENVLKEYQDKR